MTPRKQHLSDTTELILKKNMKAHTRPAQVQITQNPSTEKGNETKSHTPNQEPIYK